MATRYAVANGNWSALATWDGGASLPGVGDDVYTNGYVVQIDITISVQSLRNHTTGGVLTGGRFELSSNSDITTVDGVFGEAVASATNLITNTCLLITAAVTSNIVANFTANGAARYRHAGGCSANGANITLLGLMQGGTDNNYGFWNNGASTFIISGNQQSGVGSVGYGFLNSGAASIVITGHQIAFGGYGGHAFSQIGGATVTIFGNQYGGTGGGSYGINNTNGVSLNITGNQIAGNNYAISNSANINLMITGNSTAAAVAAIYTSAGTVVHTGNCYNNGAVMAIHAARVQVNVVPATEWIFQNYLGAAAGLYSIDNAIALPAITDVRNGVVFGAGGGLIGTLAVPPATAVGIGVPVDNTVGTAAITATDLQNAILGKVADGTYTVEDLIKAMAAIMLGKTAITDLGSGLATVAFRDLADTINRVVASMNESERTSVTITP